MARLRGLTREELGDGGQALWDDIVESRGPGVVNSDGHLIGPFNPLVRAPSVGRHLQALGTAVRAETSLDSMLIEIAILTIVSHWNAKFEWRAHSAMARNLGLPESVLESIRNEQVPEELSPEQRLAHIACKEIVRNGSLDDLIYRQVEEIFGEQGVVELVALCGYYSAVSFVINTFAVLPPDIR